MKNNDIDNNPVIFTTGAFLKPTKITDANGKDYWIWAVSEFVDDSFLNGEVFNPKEFEYSKENLLISDNTNG